MAKPQFLKVEVTLELVTHCNEFYFTDAGYPVKRRKLGKNYFIFTKGSTPEQSKVTLCELSDTDISFTELNLLIQEQRLYKLKTESLLAKQLNPKLIETNP